MFAFCRKRSDPPVRSAEALRVMSVLCEKAEIMHGPDAGNGTDQRGK
jgi:hypothetical protein